MFHLRSLVLSLLVAASIPCFAQQALDNDAVIKLAKSGIGDDLVVATINAQPGTYALSTDNMMALKSAGVSDKVIGAMIAKAAAPAASSAAGGPTANAATAGIDEVGVYYKDRSGKWIAMEPEIVNYKVRGRP